MIINHNMNAMTAHRQMGINTGNQGKAIEKLSSGQRINRAGDDAAGLAISEKMRGQIRGLDGASRNAQDGVSLIQTAEGALNETHNILQRMRELSVQGANDTNVVEDREAIQKEMDALMEEIDRISTDTEFNGQKLLNGDFNDKKLQIGANTNQSVTVDVKNMNSDALGLKGSDTVIASDVKIEMKENHSVTVDLTIGTVPAGGEEITINGTKVSIAAGADENTIAQAINDAKIEGVTAKFDGTDFTLEFSSETAGTIEFGASANITGAASTATTKGNDILKEDLKFDIDYNGTTHSLTLTAGQDKTALETELTTKLAGIDAKLAGAIGDDGKISITSNDANDKLVVGEKLGEVDVNNHKGATKSIKTIDNAINKVSSQRADLGALQNRLEHTIATNDNSAENLQAAESRIRDVDMAKEMMNLSKNNVLVQAAQSMLGQANQQPNQVLSLLR